MKNSGLLLNILVVCLLILVFSCSDDEKDAGIETPNPRSLRSIDDAGDSDDELPYSDTVKLGAKLPNPYSIDNMRAAASSLVENGVLSPSFENIQPTHYYIRFLPLDSTDMDAIYFNQDLVLWDYPLDYEILTSEGSYYRDPDLPDGQPNSQYCVVPVGMTLPNVNYEVLAELFLEDEENNLMFPSYSENSNGLSVFNYYLIEQKSHEILGVEFDRPSPRLRASPWCPEGRIMVYDRSLRKAVPVPGIQVRARNGLRYRESYTDSEGYFTLCHFTGKDVGFSIKWEQKNERFDIRTGKTGQAFTNGPNKRKTWNPVFENRPSAFWSHIFRGGWYYLNNDFGFGNKPFNRISVEAYYDEKAPKNIGGRYWPGLNVGEYHYKNIQIWRKNNDGTIVSDAHIFSVTAHEFAHAHHHEMQGNLFKNGDIKRRLQESWSEAVQYFITKLVYSSSAILNNYNKQDWSNKHWEINNDTTSKNYTPLIIDLIDANDQGSIIDKVSGFTLKQVADILAKSNTKDFDDFQTELKKLNNSNAPEKYLDVLFLEMEEGGYDSYLRNKMLLFTEIDAWKKETGLFNMMFVGNSYLNLKSMGTTNMSITGNYPIIYPNIKNWGKVGMRVLLSMPEVTPWIPTWYYAGNLQLFVSETKNGWYNWGGQFDINKNNGYVEDGKYFVQYEMIIPDYMAQMFKYNDPYLRLMFSANSGAEFNLHKIEFFNAGRDENKVLNLTQEEKNNAVLYSTFIANPYRYLSISPNLIVYKMIDGKKHYYTPGQDVDDEYKMILVERWAINPAYEPGLPSGLWRQCWIYLGKE